jgi:FKBP-type peptidyl-prolyl cis-trans isomerase SlyD
MEQSLDSRKTIQDDQVVSLDYILTVDGGVVDKSEENEPIQFIQGHGQIIPGLERQLYGMSIGESKKVVVAAAEGYGEPDSDAYAEVPRSEFPPHIPLENGVALQLRDQNGDVLDAYIVEVGSDTVRLNFNHPLAGKELHFQVTVVDLRDATDEELSHGHVHSEGEEFYDEDELDGEDFEDDDLEEEDFEEDDEEDL